MSVIPKKLSSLRACIVFSFLKVSGGVMEWLRLARDLKSSLDHDSVLTMWREMHLPHNWFSVPHVIYSQIGQYRRTPHAMDFDWFHRYYCKNGAERFRVMDAVLGDFRLGGHSDIHFRDGFAANEKILIANGMRPLLTALIRRVYIVRHLIKIKIPGKSR